MKNSYFSAIIDSMYVYKHMFCRFGWFLRANSKYSFLRALFQKLVESLYNQM